MTVSTIERAQMRDHVNRAQPVDYVTELLLCPRRIEDAEKEVAGCSDRLRTAQERLEDEEARLLSDGSIDAKNKEGRDAQMRLATSPLREEVRRLERLLEDRKITLRREQNRFSAFRSVARYLAREEE